MRLGLLRETAAFRGLVCRDASPIRKGSFLGWRKGQRTPFAAPPSTAVRCASSWTFPGFSPSSQGVGDFPGSFNLGSADNSAEEEAQDAVLEEEEFRAMQVHADEADPFLPLAHRLSRRADTLAMELRRIRWELLERRQLLMDTRGGGLRGRQANARQAIERALRRRRDAPPSTMTARDLQPYVNWCGSSSGIVRAAVFLSRRFSETFIKRQHPPPIRDDSEGGPASKEIATLTEDIDYIRRVRSYHALNYYSRMNLTPKRHLGHAIYSTLWNLWIGFQNGLGCLIFYPMREIRESGWVRGPFLGLVKGGWAALKFLAYGWIVSPAIHLPCGFCNGFYGPLNFFTGRYFFDTLSGRWMVCNTADTLLFRHLLQREKRLIRAIGRLEFKRKRMQREEKWTRRLAAMGFSLEEIGKQLMSRHGKNSGGKSSSTASDNRKSERANLYDVLGVKRTATQQQIKAQYKKLAMLFHPDVADDDPGRERQAAQSKFESISHAYRVLSNAESRQAYDRGGNRGLEIHESRFGRFLARTPEAMVQGIFGGEAFRRALLGELLRSHWTLRAEAQVCVSLHQFEELMCIRVRQLALELAAVVDVHARGEGGAGRAGPKGNCAQAERPRGGGGGRRETANRPRGPSTTESTPPSSPYNANRPNGNSKNSINNNNNNAASLELVPGSNAYNNFSKDFEERCKRFVGRLSEACFGRELLYEVGEAYVVGAQRFLHLRPFYAPKALLNRKLMAGIGRLVNAILEKKDKAGPAMGQDALAKRILIEYFNMEYDNVVADAHNVLRFAVQMVLKDTTQSEEVRKRRAYAVWWVGKKMMEKGSQWNFGTRDDGDLIAYVQQAANASATTSKPPKF